MLSAFRAELALIPWFARTTNTSDGKRSALAQLSSTGNLVAGGVARTSVGFVLNPITVIKARYEVSASGVSRRLRATSAADDEQRGSWGRLWAIISARRAASQRT